MKSISLLAVSLALLFPLTSFAQAKPTPRELLEKSRRIIFLGDSITASAGYIAHFDAWLLTQKLPHIPVVIGAGLSSETVSGLSEVGHAGGEFPRPDLAERLERVLEKTKPDLIFACYGINCGIYEPFSEERLAAYQKGMQNLRAHAAKAGATVVHITPPTFDDQRAKKPFSYNGVLDRYSDWLLSQREQGWLVIDLHYPMSQALATQQKTNPMFTFQPDAVHPNAEGHWFIAQQLGNWFGDESMTKATTPQEYWKSREISEEVTKLVQQRVNILRDAYVSAAGHKRPGVAPGLPLPEAEQKAAELTAKIQGLLRQPN
jgi:lysophospholipase L1-like esterase